MNHSEIRQTQGLKMNAISPANCDHQVIFSPSLDNAAVCKHCGAIVLISPRVKDSASPNLKWVAPAPLRDNTHAMPPGGD